MENIYIIRYVYNGLVEYMLVKAESQDAAREIIAKEYFLNNYDKHYRIDIYVPGFGAEYKSDKIAYVTEFDIW